MRPFTYTGATTKEQALQAFHPNAHYLGGGTNLVDLMKEDVERPDQLIDVNNLSYSKITAGANGGLTLGAMARNAETANNRDVRTNYPLLSMAMLSAATAQIRNMASNGGNLLQRTRCPYFFETSMPCNKREPGSGCGAKNGMNATHAIFGYSDKCVAVHPSDMCVALAALGATVEVQQPGGSSRLIDFNDFHRLPGDQPEKDTTLQPGELITAIHLAPTVVCRPLLLPENPGAFQLCLCPGIRCRWFAAEQRDHYQSRAGHGVRSAQTLEAGKSRSLPGGQATNPGQFRSGCRPGNEGRQAA